MADLHQWLGYDRAVLATTCMQVCATGREHNDIARITHCGSRRSLFCSRGANIVAGL